MISVYTETTDTLRRGLMPHATLFIRLAGLVQLAILTANFVLPAKLRCGENLVRVTPMIRSVFVVHWVYILLILLLFSVACLWFAPDLAGASMLGRFLSTAMALFWFPRIPIQLFAYDKQLRREHRLGDVAILLAFAFLVAVFGVAALAPRV